MEAVKSSGGGDVLLEQEVAVQVVEAGATVASATRRSLRLLVELRLKPAAPAKVNVFFSFTFVPSSIQVQIQRNCEWNVSELKKKKKKLIM